MSFCLFVHFGLHVVLYRLVLHSVLPICTVWFYMPFSLFVQLDSVYCFVNLYCLVLYFALLICTVWFCVPFCLFAQAGSKGQAASLALTLASLFSLAACPTSAHLLESAPCDMMGSIITSMPGVYDLALNSDSVELLCLFVQVGSV